MRAKIEPINRSLEIIFVELYSIENITIKINDANNSINKSETKHLSQDLKRLDVERIERVKIAKGEIRINTLSKMYLIEYRKVKFKNPTDTTVLIIPSMENTLDVFSSITIIESEILTSFEKQISQFKKSFPTLLIADETRLFKLIICSQIKKLQFIKIPTSINFNIN